MYRPGATAAARRFLLLRRRNRASSSVMRPTTTGFIFHAGAGRKIPLSRVVTGVVLSVPVIAILQGAMLLRDYRLKHGNAPRPDMPSRGVVVVQDSAQVEKENVDSYLASPTPTHQRGPRRRWFSQRRDTVPLRLLVVGDSLAAGVGMSKSSTPALPESIAQALSKALGGRAVYWTCFGTPGVSATEVVQQIHQLDDIPTPLTQRVAEWQWRRYTIAQEKIETAKSIAQEWWEQHKEPIDTDDEVQETTKKKNPIVRWWKRSTARIRKDVQSFKKILAKSRSDSQLENKVTTKLVHRKSLDPDFVAQYDIAVVLTGLNDLKDTFLPFMMSRQRKDMIDESKKDNNGSGLKGELIRIIHALNKKMKISNREDIASSGKGEVDSGNENRPPASPKANQKGGDRSTRMPLVVFPALPIAPIQMLQVVPLSWFVGPLIRRSDRNKQLIAEMYPDLVVYVEAPNSKVFSDAEAQRGPLWEDFQKERVLLQLTDIAQNVRERVEHLMHQYEKTWALDAEDDDDLYELDVDGVELLSDYSTSHPGASMVSADGIHPNDLGYQVFGRLIAQAIIEHWQRSGTYKIQDG